MLIIVFAFTLLPTRPRSTSPFDMKKWDICGSPLHCRVLPPPTSTPTTLIIMDEEQLPPLPSLVDPPPSLEEWDDNNDNNSDSSSDSDVPVFKNLTNTFFGAIDIGTLSIPGVNVQVPAPNPLPLALPPEVPAPIPLPGAIPPEPPVNDQQSDRQSEVPAPIPSFDEYNARDTLTNNTKGLVFYIFK